MRRKRFEIIFTTLLFAAAAVISTRMYLQADTMQNQARDLDRAVLAAQAVLEEIKAGALAPRTVFYDEDFNVSAAPDEDGFILTVSITGDGDGLYDVTADIEKLKPYRNTDETGVLTLSASVYRGYGR